MKHGVNNIRLGISAVRARLESGRLRVVAEACPNLITEAGMYRWGSTEDRRAEVTYVDGIVVRFSISSK